MAAKNIQRDQVDKLLEGYAHVGDIRIVELIARFFRIETHLDRLLNEIFAPYKLDRGQSDVLGTLLRTGIDTPLTPTVLSNSLMCSSGAMTNRLDRLEKAGLIERRDDPRDRRGTLIALTAKGREVSEQATAVRVANNNRLMPGLSTAEKQQLADLLRKVLIAFETESLTPDSENSTQSSK